MLVGPNCPTWEIATTIISIDHVISTPRLIDSNLYVENVILVIIMASCLSQEEPLNLRDQKVSIELLKIWKILKPSVKLFAGQNTYRVKLISIR